MLSVVDIYIEFPLNGVVHLDAQLYIHLVIFIVPVGLESDWNTFPSVRVDGSEVLPTHSDDSLGEDMGLLVQMMVVLIRVVETSLGDLHNHGVEADHSLSSNLALNIQERLGQHIY